MIQAYWKLLKYTIGKKQKTTPKETNLLLLLLGFCGCRLMISSESMLWLQKPSWHFCKRWFMLREIQCVAATAHHHLVWCSERIPGSSPLFWTSPPTPFLRGGPVCLGTRWQKWSAATWGEKKIIKKTLQIWEYCTQTVSEFKWKVGAWSWLRAKY